MCSDYEAPQELERGWRRARQEHKCFACRETVRRGDRYHITTQIQDGEFGTFKHCARCYAMCMALWDAGAESVDFDLHCGELWEDTIGDLPDEVAALAFMTKDEAQARLADRGGDRW